MGKRKKKAPEQRPQPAPEEAPEPDAVIAKAFAKIKIEGNRSITLYAGDIFRLPMARILWREAREYVDAWPRAEK
jgi:hypothetical protein